MNITIHRGAAQIGGCITEISTDVAKVIIDLGSNLPGCKQEDFTKEEITEVVKGADAVLYTHYHGDHVGFISMVPEAVRQYIGAGAQDVLRCKYAVLNKKGEFQKEVDAIERMLNYEASIPLQFKDLKVTPFYCSHSAFDAYMFKIEWNGKVILHTGDFRKHGYMGNKLIPMLKKYVGQVDVLITECTMLGRKDETVKTEYEIQKATKDILTSHKYVFALGSSTDIDRLASFHAACKATKRHFYVDKYQQSILDVFTKYTSSPLYDFSNSNGYKGTTFGLWEFCHINKESVVKEMQRRGFLMPFAVAENTLSRLCWTCIQMKNQYYCILCGMGIGKVLKSNESLELKPFVLYLNQKTSFLCIQVDMLISAHLQRYAGQLIPNLLSFLFTRKKILIFLLCL